MHTILELCTSKAKGGLELYFASLSYALAPLFKVHLGLNTKHTLKEHINPKLPSIFLANRSKYFPFKTAKILAHYIDTEAIELIHIHWNRDLALAVWAKRLSRKKPKLILTRHMQFPSYKGGFYHRFLYSHLDHIIAITHTMADDLKRYIPQSIQPPISTIYLGVSPLEKISKEEQKALRAPYASDNEFLIGLFGRIDPKKGQNFLIEAMHYAKEAKLPFKALIVGNSMSEAYLHELKQSVKTFQLEDEIIFTGFIKNPRALMQACDVVLLATIEETFGLVLIEAMSVGVPVIGSNRGGVPEIISHKQSGLLFESENPKALFEALKDFYHNPKLAQTCAENAQERIKERFNTQKHIKKLSQLLNTLIEQNHE